jgi:uncharacterized protein YqhQ
MAIHWRLLSRLLMIPVLAGISYEYIHFLSKRMDSPLVKLMIKPNLALQQLTTREPTIDMLEVSIKAFNMMQNLESDKENVS